MFSLIFLFVCILFALEEFVLIKPVSSLDKSDSLSRNVELLAIWLPAIGLSLTGATMGVFGAVRLHGWLNFAGALLSAAGVLLRYLSRRELGRFFTIGVIRQEEHQVIRTGPYRWVRHPGYAGFILFYVGAPLIIGSYFGLAVLSLPAVSCFIALILVEDNRLEEALGSAYTEYKAACARLIPGVW